MSERSFVPLQVAVLTISDTRTLETDTSGVRVRDLLAEAGHEPRRDLVTDDLLAIRAKAAAWIADASVDVIVTTGGTGITHRDVTPEALTPLVSKWIPGFGELFRHISFAEIGTSTIQSRAEAALCGTKLLFMLPGSTGAVTTAMKQIILPQLDYRTKPCNFVELLPRVRG